MNKSAYHFMQQSIIQDEQGRTGEGVFKSRERTCDDNFMWYFVVRFYIQLPFLLVHYSQQVLLYEIVSYKNELDTTNIAKEHDWL